MAPSTRRPGASSLKCFESFLALGVILCAFTSIHAATASFDAAPFAVPGARTRLTLETPGLGDMVQPPDDPSVFDVWDPANVSPLVAYLATEDCPATGKMFFVQGGSVKVMQGWSMGEGVEKDDRWTVAELQSELKDLLS